MGTSATDRTVFVVDDDDAALHSLVMLLKSHGMPAMGFSSGQAFLDARDPAATLRADPRADCLAPLLCGPDAHVVAPWPSDGGGPYAR